MKIRYAPGLMTLTAWDRAGSAERTDTTESDPASAATRQSTCRETLSRASNSLFTCVCRAAECAAVDIFRLQSLQRLKNMSEEIGCNAFVKSVRVGAGPKLPPTATPESRRQLEAAGGMTPWVCDVCNIVFGSAQVSLAMRGCGGGLWGAQ
jgi:hypothetical protein